MKTSPTSAVADDGESKLWFSRTSLTAEQLEQAAKEFRSDKPRDEKHQPPTHRPGASG